MFRTKKINLVLISGKLQSGKSTAARYLSNKLGDFTGVLCQTKPLASPIKKIAYDVFHWDGKKDEKGRRLLQVIGTDAGREYNENIWVEYLNDDLLSDVCSKLVFVDDWRFPNELSYFKDNFIYDVTTVRIERPIDDNVGLHHISEFAIPSADKEVLEYDDKAYYNFAVHNFGTLDEYFIKLDSIVNYLKTKIISY